MCLATFAPYGCLTKESGLIAIMSNYMRNSFSEVLSLQCNGIFGTCERDGETNFRRGISGCFECIREQQALSNWSEVIPVEISQFLRPEEISETKHFVLLLEKDEFSQASFRGENLLDLCRESLIRRLPGGSLQLHNQQNEHIVRQCFLGCARMIVAADNFFSVRLPQLMLSVGGGDFISQALIRRAKVNEVYLGSLSWEVSSRATVITRQLDGGRYNCPLFFDDVLSMRSDHRTWPYELTKILDEMLEFLGVESPQLSLPIAR